MSVRLDMATALAAFRLVYVAFIVTASAVTLVGAVHHAAGHPGWLGAAPLALLAASEIAGAILFLFRRSEVAACAALLVIYAIATALSIAAGDWSLRFFYYGTTALFILFVARREQGLV